MFIRFRVKNYRSIREKAVLDLEAMGCGLEGMPVKI